MHLISSVIVGLFLFLSYSSEGELRHSYGQNQTVTLNHPTSEQWEYKEIPANEIFKKLQNIESHAVYVQLEKRYIRKKSGNSDASINKIDNNFKKLLSKWKEAQTWAKRSKNGFFFEPAYFYLLHFFDKDKKHIESLDMTNLWYQQKRSVKFICIKDEVLPLF